jgi:8-oxo-dGTP pyrophosphatase MutT (NUDIX family)
MRYLDAVERLRALPADLPAPPDALMPVRVGTGERGRAATMALPADAMPAAVLVLVAPDRDTSGTPTSGADAEAEVILIERTARGHHSGEISFPGGRVEASDASLVEAAIREAVEEVGLDVEAAGVRIVGELESFWIPVSGFRVHPVLAIAERRPDLTASPDEVASIIRAPLAAFVAGAPIDILERRIRDFDLRYGAYPVAGHHVWGATARVLGQLGALLAGDGAGGAAGAAAEGVAAEPTP